MLQCLSKLLFLSALSSLLPLMAKTPQLITEFDLKTYSPNFHGLDDLMVKVKMAGLENHLKNQIPALKVKDLYFEIYWQKNKKPEVVVKGLPNGFFEVKDGLKKILLPRLNFIFPQKLQVTFAGFQWRQEKASGKQRLVGTDPTGKKNENRIEIDFSSSGVLSRQVTYSPLGTRRSNFKFKKYPWSKGKYVLSQSSANEAFGVKISKREIQVSYQEVLGVGLPKAVNILLEERLNVPDQKSSAPQKGNDASLEFFDYQVNQGKAKEFFKTFKR